MPLILGVTGSIASGKTFLCARLAEAHGALHVDADREIHRLYAPGTPGFGRVVGEFGPEIVGPDGIIDRKALGARVFGQPERMEALRAAIGDIPGYFMAMLRGWRTELPADGIGVFEGVNLLENGYMAICDAAWLVVCDPDTAVQRMVEQRGHTLEEAHQRLAAARDWRERAEAADRIFHNDGTRAEFEAAIDEAITETLQSFGAGTLPEPRWRTLQRERA